MLKNVGAKTESGKQRSAFRVSVLFAFVACFSLFLSLGMPGVAWMMAVSALLVNSLLVPWAGRGGLLVTLVVSSVHLFTFGPLSLIGQSGTGQLSVDQLIAMVLLPMAIPLIAIVVSASSFAVRNRGKNG
jgi:hypothetical protein